VARGGRRQGKPGKSYANRKDLNVDRVPQPGASLPAPEPEPQPAGTMTRNDLPAVLPSDVPNLSDPSGTEMSIPESLRMAGPLPGAGLGESERLLYAALKADPHNPALQRIRARMQIWGGVA